ncbi:MAG: ABC transporter ATP-binding protein [Nitrospinota bacterium]|jgi:branched-chain amino acid transport system ATP-binding protein|nr:ABC transporter ATP-binding protein [Nitrospinota bacterium]
MSAIIETRGLTKRFGGLVAVNNVDFALERGELRAVIGPNGAGKTTFFSMLAGNLDPSEGEIIFNGQDITDKAPHQISHMGIGRSFQITNIFPELTVFENIRISAQSRKTTYNWWTYGGGHKDLNDKTGAMLEYTGLEDRRDEPAGALAHGEQRYLEIGITLATDPELLLFDEPTAGMSPAETVQTADLIRKVAADHSVILVEHDMEVVMGISEWITVFHNGAVLATGAPEEVRANDDVQRVYLRE